MHSHQIDANRQFDGALAPLLIAASYFAVVASIPQVPVGELALLTLQYLGMGLVILASFLGVAMVAALLLNLFRGRFHERPLPLLKRLVVERWQSDGGVSLVVPVLLFALLLPAYTAFKQIILPTAGFALDNRLQEWGHALLLGNYPWEVTHRLFPEPLEALFLSKMYHQYFLPMAAVFLVAVLPLRPQVRTQYLLSHVMIWIVAGTLLAYLMPSSGPAFWAHFHAGPNPYAPLMHELATEDRLLIASGHPAGLGAYHYQQALQAAFGSRDLHIGRGISAMPSIHVALAVEFACAGFLIGRWAGILLSVYAAMIWMASIYLGWHFALDGIVSIAVTIALWRACGTIAKLLHSATNEAIAVPALPAAFVAEA